MDERIEWSVRQLRLFLARNRFAEARNRGTCPCYHHANPPPTVIGRRETRIKSINLTQNGALHGVFGHRGCPHSTLATSTEGHSAISLAAIPSIVIR